MNLKICCYIWLHIKIHGRFHIVKMFVYKHAEIEYVEKMTLFKKIPNFTEKQINLWQKYNIYDMYNMYNKKLLFLI